ncbi:phage tail repeat-like family [Trichomonas vaginalis G3]|uniref:phage tail repeat-like family n=1 Tax=Trichomonas vaginalis (strain ATCC PRA-98 / G3) TaxID=412133 RepID=UPI0021E618A6|nr:phage tail repeat-like family [Trichomonas vaginalis G3]KAI5494332.1 phage tail repeat-like family [Trichomonas vaginalis G3]
MIKQQQPQQLKAQTITYAIYAYNSKTAEQTQRLKYGDLEIVLKNDHFEFVCKGGAVISNIKEILFMNSKIKGITDDITSIPPEEQRYYALNAFPKVLKIGRFNLNEEFIKGFLNDIMEKADKGLVASELMKKADKEYVNEKDNEIIERVEWYHEWTSKILKTKADTGWVSGCLDLKADKTYVNDELMKKADKNHTHTSFTTVAIESIEGTVEETGGDALYCEPPNFPQGLTSDDDITTMRNIRCKDVYVMKDEHNIKFTAQDLYDKKADKKELQTLKTEILQTLYPIGSIYTSMNSTNPATVLGFGTWEQIVDRFLYCANSSKETGGSKTISGENLPAHSHYIDLSTSQAGWHKHRYWDWSAMIKGKGYDVKDNVKFAIDCYWSNTEGGGNHTHRVSGYTQTTGQSKDYMPPFMTIFAWYRVN